MYSKTNKPTKHLIFPGPSPDFLHQLKVPISQLSRAAPAFQRRFRCCPDATLTHTHTYPHTLIHTQKKNLQPCKNGVSVLQLGRFFFPENLSIVEARSVIRAIFGKGQKTTSQSHPHLKPRNPGNSAEIFHWHSKLILYIARKRVFFANDKVRSYLVCKWKIIICVYIYVIHSNTSLIRTIYYFCSYPQKKI